MDTEASRDVGAPHSIERAISVYEAYRNLSGNYRRIYAEIARNPDPTI